MTPLPQPISQTHLRLFQSIYFGRRFCLCSCSWKGAWLGRAVDGPGGSTVRVRKGSRGARDVPRGGHASGTPHDEGCQARSARGGPQKTCTQVLAFFLSRLTDGLLVLTPRLPLHFLRAARDVTPTVSSSQRLFYRILLHGERSAECLHYCCSMIYRKPLSWPSEWLLRFPMYVAWKGCCLVL